MLKRTISLLLCLCMVMTFAPAAMAEETDTTVTVGEALPEETPSEATEPLTGEEPGEQTEPVQTEEVPQETEAVTEEITVSVEGITTDAATASGTHGTNVTWKVENETLTISGTGDMAYSYSAMPWYSYRTQINRIVVNKGITSINQNAFKGLYRVATVSLPNTLKSIGAYAFQECQSLNSITIPGSVQEIGMYAFQTCHDLETVTIQEGVGSIGNYAFSGCSSLKEIRIPDSVTKLYGNEFANCTSLKQAYIGNGVKAISDYAFYGCTALEEVRLGNNVTSIGGSAFKNCGKLKKVSIPSSVLTINSYAFANCTSMTELKLQEGLDTIGSSAFENCTSLTKVTLPHSLDSLGSSAFKMCTSITQATIGDFLMSIPVSAFNGCSALEKLVIGRNVTTINDCAFHGCTSLSDITFGENVKNIFSSFGTFTECDSLTQLYLPDTLEEVGMICFSSCDNLTVVDFGESLKTIGQSALQSCPKLRTVILPATLQSINAYAFYDCKDLTDIYYKGTKEQWEQVTIGHWSIDDSVTIHYNFDGSCVDTDNDHRCDVCQKYLVNRISGDNRYDTAILVADQMKTALNVEKFDAIIVASGSNFADALAGSYLSAVKKAPVLLSFGQGGKYGYLDTNNINYIKKNLNSNGTVYILGGENAVPALYVNDLPGFNVKRLGGGNRFDTNLQILREAGVNPGDEILVCTGYDFADSLSAAATGKPILLVYCFNGKHYGIDPDFLGGLSGCSFTIIGGENAVGSDLATALSTYGSVERLAGGNRFETSTMVAKKYFQNPTNVVLAYAWEFPDGLCGGALAYAMGAPLILTMNSYEGEAVKYAKANNLTEGVVLGGKARIADVTVERILG